MPTSRYLRHEQIDGFSQQKCQALRVLVVGAGAIGNEVVKNLTLLGVGQIGLFDLDRVERHNLTRSVLLREQDIGKNKAHAVAARARDLDENTRITAVAGDIHETLDLQSVRDADIVIGCTDNFEARIRLNQFCLLTGTPWINTAIDSRYGSVELFPFDSAQQVACYECTLPPSVYERIGERQSCGGLLRAAIAQQVMPTTTITTSIAGALACNEALKHCGCDTRLAANTRESASERIFMDSLTGSSSRTSITTASLCAGCGLLPCAPSLLAQISNANQLNNVDGMTATDDILLSDRLIWHCACTHCGQQPATQQYEGKRARQFTDAITRCARCGQSSVKVDVRESFTAAELVERFGDDAIPVHWGLIDSGLIEFAGSAINNQQANNPQEST
jgi:molybdopterin/thiamine biosynthesis adenylyltransferase